MNINRFDYERHMKLNGFMMMNRTLCSRYLQLPHLIVQIITRPPETPARPPDQASNGAQSREPFAVSPDSRFERSVAEAILLMIAWREVCCRLRFVKAYLCSNGSKG